MAGIGWKQLAQVTGNAWKRLELAERGWKWQEIVSNIYKWPRMTGNGNDNDDENYTDDNEKWDDLITVFTVSCICMASKSQK